MSQSTNSNHDTLSPELDSRNPSGSESDQEMVLVQTDGLQQENARLRSLWDSQMEDKGGNGLPNRKTFALLLTWSADIDELAVAGEVDRLENILRNIYNYTVVRKCIKRGKSAQHQVRKYLADFVLEYDDENTLLIVYYAGHGSPGEQVGHLVLDSERIAPYLSAQRRNSILWHEAEEGIKNTDADILVIFDCCHTGSLVLPGRGAPIPRNFEFLGATDATGTTKAPGDGSFTSALIWSLEKFAETRSTFSVNDLLLKIRMGAPNFPGTEQAPFVESRHRKPGTIGTHLVLAIDQRDGKCGQILRPIKEEKPAHIKEFIDLRICFVKHPDDDDIISLASAFKDCIGDKSLSAQRVQWIRLQSHEHLIQSYAHRWRKQTLTSSVRNKLRKPELKVTTSALPNAHGTLLLTPPQSVFGDQTDLLEASTSPELMESPDSASSMVDFLPPLETRKCYEERQLFKVPSLPLMRKEDEEEQRFLYHVYGVIKAMRPLLRNPEFRWVSIVALLSVVTFLWILLSRNLEFTVIPVRIFNITRP